jgi:hypothetical protein
MVGLLAKSNPLTAWSMLLDLAARHDPIQGPVGAYVLSEILNDLNAERVSAAGQIMYALPRRELYTTLSGVLDIMKVPPASRGYAAGKFFGGRVWHHAEGDLQVLTDSLATVANLAAIGWAVVGGLEPVEFDTTRTLDAAGAALNRAARNVLKLTPLPDLGSQEPERDTSEPTTGTDDTRGSDEVEEGTPPVTELVTATAG